MNWIDLVIITVVLAFAINGLERGFFVQLFEIIGFLASLIIALTFYPQVAILLIRFFDLPKIAASPVGFLLVWIITESTLFALISALFKKYIQPFLDTAINRFFGFIPAAANALLICAFILLFIVSLPIRPDIKKEIFNSKIGSSLVNSASVFEKPLSSIFGPIAKQSLTFLTVAPRETGSIPLEFTQTQLSADFLGEQKMFELVNQERIKFGVQPLVWDQARAQVGRAHSEDMFKRGYFSHYSPEGKDVSDRLEEVEINYSIAGENLALAPDVSRAHTGLMNSEGHRRNILDPAFNQIGIGVVDGGVYGKMFTQVFTD